MARPLHAAVFLDRDGTIIEDRHYLGDPEGVRLLPGAAEGVAMLSKAGWPVVIVSNQSGIGRGLITEAEFLAVDLRVRDELASLGGQIAGSYHCPHDPDIVPPCECRKPRPGLFERAARELSLDLGASHYAGDRLRDVQAGLEYGGSAYLVGSGETPPASFAARVVLVDSVLEVALHVLGRSRSR